MSRHGLWAPGELVLVPTPTSFAGLGQGLGSALPALRLPSPPEGRPLPTASLRSLLRPKVRLTFHWDTFSLPLPAPFLLLCAIRGGVKNGCVHARRSEWTGALISPRTSVVALMSGTQISWGLMTWVCQ